MCSVVENYFVTQSNQIKVDKFIQNEYINTHWCETLEEFFNKFPELDKKSAIFYYEKYNLLGSSRLTEKQKNWLISIDIQIMNIKDLRCLLKHTDQMSSTEKQFVTSVKPYMTDKQREWMLRLMRKYKC